MDSEPVGWRLFTDGRTRPVFVFAQGKQYVYEDDGRPVRGLWIHRPPENPDTVVPDQIIEPTA